MFNQKRRKNLNILFWDKITFRFRITIRNSGRNNWKISNYRLQLSSKHYLWVNEETDVSEKQTILKFAKICILFVLSFIYFSSLLSAFCFLYIFSLYYHRLLPLSSPPSFPLSSLCILTVFCLFYLYPLSRCFFSDFSLTSLYALFHVFFIFFPSSLFFCLFYIFSKFSSYSLHFNFFLMPSFISIFQAFFSSFIYFLYFLNI